VRPGPPDAAGTAGMRPGPPGCGRDRRDAAGTAGMRPGPPGCGRDRRDAARTAGTAGTAGTRPGFRQDLDSLTSRARTDPP
jgi:hypothetical protein